jgi:hypothetical protein
MFDQNKAMISLFELSTGMASPKVLSERAQREGTYIPPTSCLFVQWCWSPRIFISVTCIQLSSTSLLLES